MHNLLSKTSLDSLIHFHYIASFRSLSKAAQYLHLSAPAMTHSLTRLEGALDLKLCHRGRDGFRLTDHGAALYSKTQVIVGQLDEFESFGKTADSFSGMLSIGVLDNFENANLQNAIDVTIKHFPKLRLNMIVVGSDLLGKMILANELDLAAGIFHQKIDQLQYLKIGESTLKYYVSRNHPLWRKRVIAREDLSGQKVAWVDNKRRNIFELETDVYIDHPRYKMKFAGYANQLDGAMAILRSGHAIVPMPPTYIQRLKDHKDFRELDVATRSPSFVEECVFKLQHRHSPAADFLLSTLRELKA